MWYTGVMSVLLSHVEAVLFSPRPSEARPALALLLLSGALMAALLVAAAGPLYAIAGFLALAGSLLILRDMRWGMIALFAVVALIPFAAFPFKIGFTPSFLDAALAAVYLVWILRIATRRQLVLAGSRLGILVGLFALLAIFAFANGLRHSAPTPTALRNFAEMLLGIFFFFVLVNTLHTQDDLDLVTRVLVFAGAAAAGIAVLFYFIPEEWTVRILDALARFNYPGGYGALRYVEDDPANPMRAIGTHVDPNVLGGFLILVTGLTIPQLASPRPLFRRSWIVVFAGLQVFALYLTYSRGSLVGLAIGMLLIGLLRYRRLLLIVVAGVCAILILPQAQAYLVRFIEGVQLQDQATLMRLGEYKDAFALILRYPWFGVGFTGSPDADLYVGVSSVYLLMAEEMGMIGVAAFLAVVAGFFVNLAWAWRKTADARLEALLLGLAAAVTGVVVGGLLDHYLFNLVYPHMTILFWTYLGLGMSAVQVLAGSQLGHN